VRALGRQFNASILPVETCPPLDKTFDLARPFFCKNANRLLIAKAGASGQRVGKMQFSGIGFPNCGRDAALRIAGVRLPDFCLRQNENAACGSQIQSRAKARRPASYNNEVCIDSFASLAASHDIKMS
jgi:hypothetical protein